MKVATINSEFNYHPKCGSLKITNLAFSNDLILFARGDVTFVLILMHYLSTFGECSRLIVNLSKTNLYMVGICGEELEESRGRKHTEGNYAF